MYTWSGLMMLHRSRSLWTGWFLSGLQGHFHILWHPRWPIGGIHSVNVSTRRRNYTVSISLTQTYAHLGWEKLNWGVIFIRRVCLWSMGRFLYCLVLWEIAAHCGCYHPWAGGPRLCKIGKEVCEQHSSVISSSIPASRFLRCLPLTMIITCKSIKPPPSLSQW